MEYSDSCCDSCKKLVQDKKEYPQSCILCENKVEAGHGYPLGNGKICAKCASQLCYIVFNESWRKSELL